MSIVAEHTLDRAKPHILRNKDGLFLGRKQGEELAVKIIAAIEKLGPDSVLPLNFGDVVSMDSSCVDGFLTLILRRTTSGELGSRYVVLEDISDDVVVNIKYTLAARNMVCPYKNRGRAADVIGDISQELLGTYKFIEERGGVTAEDFEKMPGTKNLVPSAISNRLARLQKMGLVVRQRRSGAGVGGQHFTYAAVT